MTIEEYEPGRRVLIRMRGATRAGHYLWLALLVPLGLLGPVLIAVDPTSVETWVGGIAFTSLMAAGAMQAMRRLRHPTVLVDWARREVSIGSERPPARVPFEAIRELSLREVAHPVHDTCEYSVEVLLHASAEGGPPTSHLLVETSHGLSAAERERTLTAATLLCQGIAEALEVPWQRTTLGPRPAPPSPPDQARRGRIIAATVSAAMLVVAAVIATLVALRR